MARFFKERIAQFEAVSAGGIATVTVPRTQTYYNFQIASIGVTAANMEGVEVLVNNTVTVPNLTGTELVRKNHFDGDEAVESATTNPLSYKGIAASAAAGGTPEIPFYLPIHHERVYMRDQGQREATALGMGLGQSSLDPNPITSCQINIKLSADTDPNAQIWLAAHVDDPRPNGAIVFTQKQQVTDIIENPNGNSNAETLIKGLAKNRSVNRFYFMQDVGIDTAAEAIKRLRLVIDDTKYFDLTAEQNYRALKKANNGILNPDPTDIALGNRYGMYVYVPNSLGYAFLLPTSYNEAYAGSESNYGRPVRDFNLWMTAGTNKDTFALITERIGILQVDG